VKGRAARIAFLVDEDLALRHGDWNRAMRQVRSNYLKALLGLAKARHPKMQVASDREVALLGKPAKRKTTT